MLLISFYSLRGEKQKWDAYLSPVLLLITVLSSWLFPSQEMVNHFENTHSFCVVMTKSEKKLKPYNMCLNVNLNVTFHYVTSLSRKKSIFLMWSVFSTFVRLSPPCPVAFS